MAIYTPPRRKMLGKTLMNASLIVMGAAFGSDIFLNFAVWVKMVSGLFAVGLGAAGFFVYPPKADDKEE
jgi:hypothetical protein